MPFDALHSWCLGLERDLDAKARLGHWIGHEPDAWQVNAFTTRATEVEMLADGQAYFDLSIIEQATSTEGAICPRF